MNRLSLFRNTKKFNKEEFNKEQYQRNITSANIPEHLHIPRLLFSVSSKETGIFSHCIAGSEHWIATPILPYELRFSPQPCTQGIILYPQHQHDIQIYYYSTYNKKFVRTCASVQVSDFIPELSSSSAAHFPPAYFPLSS